MKPSETQQAGEYVRDGLVGPIAAFPPPEAADLRTRLDRDLPLPVGAAALAQALPLPLERTRNRHLDCEVVDLVAQSPLMRGTASALLGEGATLWRSQFFFGLAGGGVRWHRDEYHNLLSTDSNQISLHLGLSESVPSNCVSVIPGSHRLSDAELEEKHGLRRIATDADKAYGTPQYEEVESGVRGARMMLLQPGEYFAFHPRLVHASIDIRPRATRKRAEKFRAVKRRLGSVLSKPGGGAAVPIRWGIALRVAGAGVEAGPGAWAQTPESLNEVRPYT